MDRAARLAQPSLPHVEAPSEDKSKKTADSLFDDIEDDDFFSSPSESATTKKTEVIYIALILPF